MSFFSDLLRAIPQIYTGGYQPTTDMTEEEKQNPPRGGSGLALAPPVEVVVKIEDNDKRE